MKKSISFLFGLCVIGGIALALVVDPFGMISPGVFAGEAGLTENGGGAVPGAYTQLTNTLVKVFVIAVLIEVALSVLFRWRIFLRYFEGRGVKVPISFFFSLAVVVTHKIDLPGEVVAALDGLAKPVVPTDIGLAVSALIIAGGSASVNSVFKSLGWRNPLEQNQIAQDERMRTQARLRIEVTREHGGETEGRNLVVRLDGAVVGTIASDRNEFGGSEGYTVKAGQHKVDVAWNDPSGQEQKQSRTVTVAKGGKAVETFALP
jgi:hypothetical protein